MAGCGLPSCCPSSAWTPAGDTWVTFALGCHGMMNNQRSQRYTLYTFTGGLGIDDKCCKHPRIKTCLCLWHLVHSDIHVSATSTESSEQQSLYFLCVCGWLVTCGGGAVPAATALCLHRPAGHLPVKSVRTRHQLTSSSHFYNTGLASQPTGKEEN